MNLKEQMKKEADNYNKHYKDWEVDGRHWKQLLKSIKDAAKKGEYVLTYQLGKDQVPEMVIDRLKKEGFSAHCGWMTEERLKTDTYETVGYYQLTVRWS